MTHPVISALERAGEGSREPPGVHYLAVALARDWCDLWGGWDKTGHAERLGLVEYFKTEASGIFAKISKLSKMERAAIAAHVKRVERARGNPK